LFSQQEGVPPLFASREALSLTLTMDMRKVLKDTDEDREQHPAMIEYLAPGGDTVRIPVRVRTRGHFRRNPMNCNFPPLRLNFSNTPVANSVFEGQDKVKLVTHCRSRGDKYVQNVLKEYLCYRFYELLTEEGFKVRLANIRYADSQGKRDTLYKMGFLIEAEKHMVARNNMIPVEIRNVRQEQCDSFKTSRMSVFQYMIGNTDWSVAVPHNIILMQEKPGVPPVAVPYDFDWCGLVTADYAVPAENLPISSVRERLFRGMCRNEQEFEMVFTEFRAIREEVFNTIEAVPGIDPKVKGRVIKYIEDFYETLDNPRSVRSEFLNKCR
jgi:hypothetical protein